MESNRNSIVPVLLDSGNYKIWSRCMKNYLLSQDLWDVIKEDKPKSSKSSHDSSNNNVKIIWRKKNASALYAIQMSCGPNYLSQVAEVNTAKEAWNLLASQFSTENDSNTMIMDDDDEESTHASGITAEDDDTSEEYNAFVKATEEGDWTQMETFINSHREVLTATVFPGGRTALHFASDERLVTIAKSLVVRMERGDLEKEDENGYTALAVAAGKNNNLNLLRAMDDKNKKLASIGDERTLPVLIAAKNGCEETIDFLFKNTDMKVLDPNTSTACLRLLNRCINLNYFDVAQKLVKRFPKVLEQNLEGDDETFPILSIAKMFPTLRSQIVNKIETSIVEEEFYLETSIEKKAFVHALMGIMLGNYGSRSNSQLAVPSKSVNLNKAYDDRRIDSAIEFLHLVCDKVSAFHKCTLAQAVHAAMIESTRNGSIEFITLMLSANPELLWARNKKGNMFLHAVLNRRHEIFNLIYGAREDRDELLSFEDEGGNNIVHYAAMLPPMSTLDRISTNPMIQIQKELQWFQEVKRLANPCHRNNMNKDGLTPYEVFDQSHKTLIHLGEKSIKNTAKSCTTVCALNITIMFAAILTVPGGNSQNTGYPFFKDKGLLKMFILCDAISLSAATASILIFLHILASSFVVEDFLLKLPMHITTGLLFLFISMLSMMLAFFSAVSIMFGGLSAMSILVLLISYHVLFYMYSICLLSLKFSGFSSNIFEINTELPKKKEFNETMSDQSNVAIELSDE